MRAAVVRNFREPLRIEERPVPEPGPGQVRVHIETSGICHTDIHAARGDWPVKPPLPLVPGHEGVGLVDAVGEGVTRVSVGRRVAIPTFVFERVAWERRFDRTVGWSFAVGRAHASDRALFCVTSLDGALADLGTRAEVATVAV